MIRKPDLHALIPKYIQTLAPKFRVLLHRSGVYDDDFYKYLINSNKTGIPFEYVVNKLICLKTDSIDSKDQGYNYISNSLSDYFSNPDIESYFFNNISQREIDDIFSIFREDDKYEEDCKIELFRMLTTTTFNVYLVNVTELGDGKILIKL